MNFTLTGCEYLAIHFYLRFSSETGSIRPSRQNSERKSPRRFDSVEARFIAIEGVGSVEKRIQGTASLERCGSTRMRLAHGQGLVE